MWHKVPDNLPTGQQCTAEGRLLLAQSLVDWLRLMLLCCHLHLPSWHLVY
jgi:hypothetical protein